MTSDNDELLQLLYDFRQKTRRAMLVRAANAIEAMVRHLLTDGDI